MRRLFGVLGTLLLVVTLCSQLYAGHAAAAASSEGLNIITSPLPIKLTTTPGSTVTADLRMKNQGTQPEDIKVGLMKFAATGELGQPNIEDLTSKDEVSSWVQFSPSVFTADPNIWNTVHMTITVPKTASLGYYLAVTFSRASQPNVKAANFKGAVATLVLLEIQSPNEKRELTLTDFTANHGLYEYLPVTFNVKLHNSGNIHVTPAGNIFIERSGKPISNITFNQAGGTVLPGSNRVFKVVWNSGFPLFKDKIVNGKPVPGKNADPQQTLTWNFADASNFRIGRYTARLLLAYDNGKQDIPLESVVSFWVLPWKLLLVLLLFIAIIGFGIWSASKSFFHTAHKKIPKRRPDAKN